MTDNYEPTGDIYDGALVDGKREGQGVLTYATGEILKGQWRNGVLVDGETLPAPAETAPAAAAE